MMWKMRTYLYLKKTVFKEKFQAHLVTTINTERNASGSGHFFLFFSKNNDTSNNNDNNNLYRKQDSEKRLLDLDSARMMCLHCSFQYCRKLPYVEILLHVTEI